MLQRFPFLPLLLFTFFACTPEKELHVGKALLLPQPLEQTAGVGHFVFTEGLRLAVENEAQAALLVSFQDDFGRAAGWRPEVTTAGPANFRLTTNPGIAAEGYALSVSPDSVLLQAATNAGFFYGLQTLRQLLPPDFAGGDPQPEVQWAIPAVQINDAPAFGWRGFMLDVSRHFFTVEQVKEVLDMVAAQKMNRFHWHLTDDQGWRIEIKSYPKLTEIGAWRADRTNTDERYSDWWGRAPLQPGEEPTYGGFYTQEEIREVVAYAKERFIEIVPEIDMPGHAQAAVAAYPEIGCVNALPHVATGGVFKNNTINPGKEETYVFAEKMLNEVMDLFPFDYVHIGGDECNKEQWKIDPAAQAKMRAEGLKSEEELQSYFIRRMEQLINARGKKMIGWDEILEGGLAPNAVVMSWRGEAGGLAAIAADHEVIMTPSNYCYVDLKQGNDDQEPNLGYSQLLLSTAYNYQVIPDDLTPEQARLILGIQANMWTESISDWGKFTYMALPRLYAVAENAWSAPAGKDWDSFTDRVMYNNARLDARNVRYAVSAFSPWIHHQRIDDKIMVTLTTEANGLDLRYTLDGSAPTLAATAYTGPFALAPGDVVTARAYADSVAVGYAAAQELPVHLAAGQAVTDATNAPQPKLTNLQYSRFTPVDTNWVKVADEATFTINFAEPTRVSSLRFNALRYTISGIYPPGEVEVWGDTTGNGEFVSLGSISQPEAAARQGRNKVETRVSFAPTEVMALRVKASAFARIPAGHHKAGAAARMYIDELVAE